jgi:hypothetical protein
VTAFIWTATASNSSSDYTVIDNAAINGDPNAFLEVTQVWEGTYDTASIGVWYDGSNWTIFNEDHSAVPVGAMFNVLVVSQ